MYVFTNVYRDLFSLHEEEERWKPSFVKIIDRSQRGTHNANVLFVVPEEPIFSSNEEYLFINICNF